MKRYRPAENSHRVERGQGSDPRYVLRSHPKFPKTLAPAVEAKVYTANPAWPERSVDWVLDRLNPPCHADWEASRSPKIERGDKQKPLVVFVRPGPRPVPTTT